MQYKNGVAVLVHPRITERHPEIAEKDVLHAWHRAIKSALRDTQEDVYVSVGVDSKGRLLELVARRCDRAWIIYHAFTPPTKKMLKELKMR